MTSEFLKELESTLHEMDEVRLREFTMKILELIPEEMQEEVRNILSQNHEYSEEDRFGSKNDGIPRHEDASDSKDLHRQKYWVLKEYFGYESFREGQEVVIDAILDQQDALAVLPTGYGKSICYQVASLLLDGVTFVVSPLIALMNEQVGSLVQTGVRAAYINSSLTPGKIRTVLKRIAEGWYDIVYLSPERLSDPVFVEFAQTLKINLIAIDEAHCISRWGHDFRPSYLQIIEFIEALENRPVVAGFTATATARVQQDICDNLRLKDPVRVTESYDRPNLYFDVKHLKPSKKRSFIVHYAKEHAGQTGIVYCMTRKNVEQLTEELQENGVKAAGYHAGMDMGTRQKNREDFLYDRIDVIVATNAFGMGINKPDVRYVIHLNMPSSLEDYYQEAGRAGRDGERAECILLFTRQDIVNIKNFFLSGENGSDHRSLDERKLNDIVRYCQTTTCLRRFYKDVIFDTSPVAGKVYKNSENRRKQGVSCGFRCIVRCSIDPVRAQPRYA